jgi:hypothetical protein
MPVSSKEMSIWDNLTEKAIALHAFLTLVSIVRRFGSSRNETMSSSLGSPEDPQLTLVRELDFDSMP